MLMYFLMDAFNSLEIIDPNNIDRSGIYRSQVSRRELLQQFSNQSDDPSLASRSPEQQNIIIKTFELEIEVAPVN
jgi:hypothetical protein